MLTFKNFAEAQHQGFRPAVASRIYGRHKGCVIAGFDVSGIRPMGLTYGLRAIIPEEFTKNYMGVTSDRHFGQSQPVRLLTLENSIAKQVSRRERELSVVQMFSEKELQEALEEAIDWINRWFQFHPKAMEQAYLQQRNAQTALAS